MTKKLKVGTHVYFAALIKPTMTDDGLLDINKPIGMGYGQITRIVKEQDGTINYYVKLKREVKNFLTNSSEYGDNYKEALKEAEKKLRSKFKVGKSHLVLGALVSTVPAKVHEQYLEFIQSVYDKEVEYIDAEESKLYDEIHKLRSRSWELQIGTRELKLV